MRPHITVERKTQLDNEASIAVRMRRLLDETLANYNVSNGHNFPNISCKLLYGHDLPHWEEGPPPNSGEWKPSTSDVWREHCIASLLVYRPERDAKNCNTHRKIKARQTIVMHIAWKDHKYTSQDKRDANNCNAHGLEQPNELCRRFHFSANKFRLGAVLAVV
jgi:hypothetical protein